MTTTPEVTSAGADALTRLASYRELRASMPQDVRDAAAAGATQAEISRVSGLSRQWVAKVIAEGDAARATLRRLDALIAAKPEA